MTRQELQERIDLYQSVMDGCNDDSIEHFGLAEAVRGEQPTQAWLDFQDLIDKAGLSTSFFDNADPLYARAEKQRDLYQRWLDEKNILLMGISIA